MKVAGLVLAAGAGRRYGGPKALARLGSELLVERAVRLLAAGDCEPTFVVLGAAADDVLAVADLSGATPVIARDWADGLSASLCAGLVAVDSAEADAVVLTLVDQPGIGVEAVRRLRFAAAGGAVAAVATYDGMPRHPVLLARQVWSAVAESAVGDTGARGWLRAHPDQVVAVDCDGTGDPHDVDTQDDLEQRRRAQQPSR